MAGTIKQTTILTLTNGIHKETFNVTNLSITQTGQGQWRPVLSIGTTEESYSSFGDVATPGRCIIQNLDDTNYVKVGFSTGVYGLRIPPGEHIDVRLEPGLTLYMIANSAACKVLIWILEG